MLPCPCVCVCVFNFDWILWVSSLVLPGEDAPSADPPSESAVGEAAGGGQREAPLPGSGLWSCFPQAAYGFHCVTSRQVRPSLGPVSPQMGSVQNFLSGVWSDSGEKGRLSGGADGARPCTKRRFLGKSHSGHMISKT